MYRKLLSQFVLAVPGLLGLALLLGVAALPPAQAQDDDPQTTEQDGNQPTSQEGDEQPKDDQPKDDQPKDDQPKDDQPKDDQPKDDQPKDDQPKDDQPKDDQPKDDQPKDDQPKDDQPKDDQPKDDQPKDDQPKDDQPKDDQPKDDQPKDDQPKDDQPKDDQPKDGEPKAKQADDPGAVQQQSAAPEALTKLRELLAEVELDADQSANVVDYVEALAFGPFAEMSEELKQSEERVQDPRLTAAATIYRIRSLARNDEKTEQESSALQQSFLQSIQSDGGLALQRAVVVDSGLGGLIAASKENANPLLQQQLQVLEMLQQTSAALAAPDTSDEDAYNAVARVITQEQRISSEAQQTLVETLAGRSEALQTRSDTLSDIVGLRSSLNQPELSVEEQRSVMRLTRQVAQASESNAAMSRYLYNLLDANKDKLTDSSYRIRLSTILEILAARESNVYSSSLVLQNASDRHSVHIKTTPTAKAVVLPASGMLKLPLISSASVRYYTGENWRTVDLNEGGTLSFDLRVVGDKSFWVHTFQSVKQQQQKQGQQQGGNMGVWPLPGLLPSFVTFLQVDNDQQQDDADADANDNNAQQQDQEKMEDSYPRPLRRRFQDFRARLAQRGEHRGRWLGAVRSYFQFESQEDVEALFEDADSLRRVAQVIEAAITLGDIALKEKEYDLNSQFAEAAKDYIQRLESRAAELMVDLDPLEVALIDRAQDDFEDWEYYSQQLKQPPSQDPSALTAALQRRTGEVQALEYQLQDMATEVAICNSKISYYEEKDLYERYVGYNPPTRRCLFGTRPGSYYYYFGLVSPPETSDMGPAYLEAPLPPVEAMEAPPAAPLPDGPAAPMQDAPAPAAPPAPAPPPAFEFTYARPMSPPARRQGGTTAPVVTRPTMTPVVAQVTPQPESGEDRLAVSVVSETELPQAVSPDIPDIGPTRSQDVHAMRLWSDSTGNHQARGRLVSFNGRVAVIQLESGRHSTVPIERLNVADRELLVNSLLNN